MEISPYSFEEVPRDWELDSHLDCDSPHYELPDPFEVEIDEMDSDITPPMPDASDPGTPSTMSSSAD